jgi:integrase
MSSILYKRKNSPYWWFKLPAVRGESRPLQGSTKTTDKRKAQEFLDKLKAQRWEADKLGIKPAYLWDDAADRWLRETGHKRSHHVDMAYIRYLHPYLGGKALQDIDRNLIDYFKFEKRKACSESGVNRYLGMIRAILRKARDEWEMVDKIPKITLFQEPPGRTRSLTVQEFARLHAELPSHLADMALFAVATGMRQGNIKNLQWCNVNLDIGHAWVDAQHHKNGHAQGFPLNEAALSVLRMQGGKHPQYVFTYNDKPVVQVGTKAWREALKRAGITDFRWHDLRHTWATWQREQGTPTYELQRLGGWRSQSMVERYAHVGHSHLQTASKRVDNLLEGYITATPNVQGSHS